MVQNHQETLSGTIGIIQVPSPILANNAFHQPPTSFAFRKAHTTATITYVHSNDTLAPKALKGPNDKESNSSETLISHENALGTY